MKWMVVASTRPEVIKVSPILRELESQDMDHVFVTTGQHYDDAMFKSFILDLNLASPDHDLKVGSASQAQQTGEALVALEKLILDEKPDVVAAEGDTNSVLSAALAAVKLKVPFAHVEAGLRSTDMGMPEEVNRILADHTSQILFAPTETSALNLVNEGISPGMIHVVGNTIVDATLQNIKIAREKAEEKHPRGKLLLTLHRPENVDETSRLSEIIAAVAARGDEVLFPVHPRTKNIMEQEGITVPGNIRLMEPLRYLDFLVILSESRAVLTDSGGVQEEAICLHVPCITLRTTTERPETVEAGGNIIAGVHKDGIENTMENVLGDPEVYEKMKAAPNPFGDGSTGGRIVKITEEAHSNGTLKIEAPDFTKGFPKRKLIRVEGGLCGKRISDMDLIVVKVMDGESIRFPYPDLVLEEGQVLEVITT
jgi:UDP-N-acetylglucosamine 2-epimerase (non-hydrolysing)